MEEIRLSDVIPVWKSEVLTETDITKVSATTCVLGICLMVRVLCHQ